jgi:alcohol dehydrogenase (NADP+)
MFKETNPSEAIGIATGLLTKGYAAQNATSGLAPWNFERRSPGPKDVQIEIKFCGVCHTDIHFVRNDWGISMYPMVPGHEIVGVVTNIGDQVRKFKQGDTVGIGCLVDSCGACDKCDQGLEQYCQGSVYTYSWYEKDGKTVTYGGYSNQIVVNEDFVVRISDNLPLEKVAPLLCAGITTYSPIKKWGIGENHKVGIVGLGGLGHLAVKFATSFGAEVTVLSTSPNKEADARRLGAHNFIFTKDEQLLQAKAEYFDFIIDTVASAHNYNIYLNMLKTDGTLICLGIPPEPMEVAAFPLLFRRRNISGSLIGGIGEMQEMMNYCAENQITADVEVIDIKDVNHAYERMEKSDVKYRFVIDLATL